MVLRSTVDDKRPFLILLALLLIISVPRPDAAVRKFFCGFDTGTREFVDGVTDTLDIDSIAMSP